MRLFVAMSVYAEYDNPNPLRVSKICKEGRIYLYIWTELAGCDAA